MNLKESEKVEIKNLVKKVTCNYIKELQYIVDAIDHANDIDDIEDTLSSNEITQNYTNFNTFAQYLLGVDMSCTPRDLFWNLETGQRDCLWTWLQDLPVKLFKKIDKHIDSFNQRV